MTVATIELIREFPNYYGTVPSGISATTFSTLARSSTIPLTKSPLKHWEAKSLVKECSCLYQRTFFVSVQGLHLSVYRVGKSLSCFLNTIHPFRYR